MRISRKIGGGRSDPRSRGGRSDLKFRGGRSNPKFRDGRSNPKFRVAEGTQNSGMICHGKRDQKFGDSWSDLKFRGGKHDQGWQTWFWLAEVIQNSGVTKGSKILGWQTWSKLHGWQKWSKIQGWQKDPKFRGGRSGQKFRGELLCTKRQSQNAVQCLARTFSYPTMWRDVFSSDFFVSKGNRLYPFSAD